jgi:glutathione S-transferase
VIVWESQAIMRYLAARHGRGIFWSEDHAERSRIDQWLDWSQTILQPDFVVGVFWGFYRTPEPQRNLPAVEERIRRCAGHFRLLDRLIADGPFLLGDRLSLADIAIGTHLYRYFNLEIVRPAVPNVQAWYRRLQDRPAYRTHVMVPFEELHGRLAP